MRGNKLGVPKTTGFTPQIYPPKAQAQAKRTLSIAGIRNLNRNGRSGSMKCRPRTGQTKFTPTENNRASGANI